MAFGSSRSSTTTQDNRRIVGSGGVLITQDATGDGSLVVDFRDEEAVGAAVDLGNRAIVTTQDIGALALELARQSDGAQDTLRLALIAAFALGAAYVVTRRA